MSEKLNYKSGLLYLYWVMSGADGKKKFDSDDPEWKAMSLMREEENIDDEDFDKFINSDLGTQKEQINKIIDLFNRCTHEQKIRALAWMDLVMIADGKIHTKEYELYTMVRKEFNVEEDDIKKDKVNLPNLS